jgi:raffinose/stachyose/melibiose transport system permease protein
MALVKSGVGNTLSLIGRYVFCFVIFVLIAVPLYIAVSGGFKSMGQLLVDPIGLPIPFDPFQYGDMLTGKLGDFWRALFNSCFVALFTVLLTLIFCGFAAFSLARINFKINNVIYGYFMLGILFPLAVAILPLYLQIKRLGLINSYWGVILPQVAFQVPMQVMLMYGFFRAIPQDLEDACKIDGYGPMGFLWFMVIPLSTPILSTVAILTLIGSWNNFFLPLLVFNDVAKFTLPMGVMNFQGEHMSNWNQILAYLSLAMIPAVILYLLAQKYIVAGLTGGAVKG